MKPKRILFVTSTYARTGSEIALYNLVNNIGNYSDAAITVSANEHGELLELPGGQDQSFCLADFNKSGNHLFARGWNKVTGYREPSKLKKKYIDLVLARSGADTVVLNTLIMAEYLELLKEKPVRIVLLVHEMDWTYTYFDGEILEAIVKVPELIVCCSNAAAEGIQQLGRQNRIVTAYPGVDFENIKLTKARGEVLQDTGFPADSKLLVMSGTLDPNKDPVFFVKLAKALLELDLAYRFLWLGGNINSGAGYYARKIAQASGIAHAVHFTGHVTGEYYNYLAAADAFLLTSKFDSFPLVMVEAGYLGKPVIGFRSGGISEYLEQGTGLLVKEREPHVAAMQIHSYMIDGNGQFNKEDAIKNARKYSAENAAKALLHALNN